LWVLVRQASCHRVLVDASQKRGMVQRIAFKEAYKSQFGEKTHSYGVKRRTTLRLHGPIRFSNGARRPGLWRYWRHW
jgi:hypothetical protein